MNDMEWTEQETIPSDEDIPVVRLTAPDRRRHLRLRPSALSAMVFVGSEKYIVSIRDISQSGVKVVNAPTQIQEGEEFALLAGLNGPDLLQVRCRAAYISGGETRREVGAEFVDIAAEDTQQLLRYLETLGMEILYR